MLLYPCQRYCKGGNCSSQAKAWVNFQMPNGHKQVAPTLCTSPTLCTTPTHCITPSTVPTPPRSDPSLHAWVEQLDAQQPCVQEPMPSYKALRPGYPQPTYPYDPTLSEIINDGTVQQVQGGSIVVYTTAFNRPPGLHAAVAHPLHVHEPHHGLRRHLSLRCVVSNYS